MILAQFCSQAFSGFQHKAKENRYHYANSLKDSSSVMFPKCIMMQSKAIAHFQIQGVKKRVAPLDGSSYKLDWKNAC